MDKLNTYALCAAMRAQSRPSLAAARVMPNDEWLTIQTNRSAEYALSIDDPESAQQPAAQPKAEHSARPMVQPAKQPTYLREIHARHNRLTGKK